MSEEQCGAYLMDQAHRRTSVRCTLPAGHEEAGLISCMGFGPAMHRVDDGHWFTSGVALDADGNYWATETEEEG